MPPRKSPNALTARESRFCEEYIVDLNGTQAAIRAGYSPKSANQIAAENMSKPFVRARIETLAAARTQRTQITADRVLQEVSRQAFVRPSSFLVPGEDGALWADFGRMTADDIDGLTQVEFEEGVRYRIEEPGKKGKVTEQMGSMVRKVKIDRIPALTLLGRHLNLWAADQPPPPPADTEKRRITVNVLVQALNAKAQGVHVHVEDGRPERAAALNGAIGKLNGKANGHG